MRKTILLCAALLACGSSIPREQLLSDLAQAMREPLADADTSARHSRVVQESVDGDALAGLRRDQVEAAIGQGDPCSRHPRCAELGYEADDWFYEVGQFDGEGSGGVAPLLIVGFDSEGRVDSVWNLRTH